MKTALRAAAALLALLMLVPLASCGGKGGAETETEEGNANLYADGYMGAYADNTAAEEWVKANIEGTDTPPVYFTLGGKASDSFGWTKTVGETVTYTDYEKSDHPVQRNCTEIEYVSEEAGIKITLTLTSYPGYPVVEYDSFITNITDKDSELLEDLSCINAKIGDGEGYTLHYNRGAALGGNAYDYQPYSAGIGTDGIKLAITDGSPSGEYLPFFNAADKNGGGVIAAVNWQGSWFAELKTGEGLSLHAGQNGVALSMTRGERFKIPGMVLIFYKNGEWQYGQNIWRRWIIEHNLMRYTDSRDFSHNLYLCSDFSGPAKDLSNISKAVEKGLNEKYNCVYEFDCGWDSGVGNWYPNKLYADGKLKEISDKCHENGIKFCMWAEVERLTSQSKLGKELGDNAIYLGAKGEYLKYKSVKNSNVVGYVNYSKQEACDAIVSLLDGLIKENGMDVYRQDSGILSDYYWDAYDAYESEELGLPRAGATENHACENYMNVWKRLEELNPGLVIDSCACGGRRNDLEMLRYSFMHTKSDYWADGNAAQCQNFGLFSWYIFPGTGFYLSTESYEVRTRISLSLGIGAIDLSDSILNAVEQWSSVHKYMYKDYYQLTGYSYDASDTLAFQFNNFEDGEGMIMAYLRSGGVYQLKAYGFEPDKNYKIWDADDPDDFRIMSGEALMTEGIVAATDNFSVAAKLYLYERTDEETTPFNKEEYLKKLDIMDLSSYKLSDNDEDKLLQLASKIESTEKSVDYLCCDYDGAGGIYVIGETVYKKLLKYDAYTKSGWQLLDYANCIAVRKNAYPISSWQPGTVFDVRGYVKQIGDRYFLWLDNSFSLGDPDGGWKDGTEVQITNGGSFKSDTFELRTADPKVLGNRLIQYVGQDSRKKGTIYICEESVWNSLPRGTEKKTECGMEWTELDGEKAFFLMPHTLYHNADNYALITRVSLKSFAEDYGGKVWIGEGEKGRFIYIENVNNGKHGFTSDRWSLYWIAGDTVRRAEFYLVTRSGRAIAPKALIDFSE